MIARGHLTTSLLYRAYQAQLNNNRFSGMLLWEALQLMAEAKDDPLISVLVDQINAIEVVPYSEGTIFKVKN
jgi:hypothetical protein